MHTSRTGAVGIIPRKDASRDSIESQTSLGLSSGGERSIKSTARGPGHPPDTADTRAKRQKISIQQLYRLQNEYEKNFRKKVTESNAQVETKRKGGHVDVVQPVTVRHQIPFLFSEEKERSLKKYLDSNEPRILVPRSYIKNEISLSQHDSYFKSFRNGVNPSITDEKQQTIGASSTDGEVDCKELKKIHWPGTAFNATAGGQPTNDYSAFGGDTTCGGPRGDNTTGGAYRQRTVSMNLSSMFKKQVVGGSAGSKIQNTQNNNQNSNRKKTTRLFNVQNQSTNSFLKASDVLLSPFSMSERKTDRLSEK